MNKEKITLRDLYFECIIVDIFTINYPIIKLLHDEQPFIFKDMQDFISTNYSTVYPKLLAYLSSNEYQNPYGPIGDKIIKANVLDEMLLNLYGCKKCNIMIDNFRYHFYPFKENNYYKYVAFSLDLSAILVARFAERWEQVLTELSLDYNPIHNYDMVEDEKVNSRIITDTANEHKVQGFNSATYQPENQDTGQQVVSGSDDDNKRHLTRSGNIGVTTSQQMLESEIKLRDENIFIKRILQDVANYITVGVYD